MANEQLFQETCEVFDLRRCAIAEVQSETFLDPCSCYTFYQCSTNYEMLHQECAPGTALDPATMGCIHYQEVTFNQPCDESSNVWTRCNTTESRLEQLEYICTNVTKTTVSTTSSTATSNPSSTDKINPGIIIGSIIGGAVLAVIVLIAIFLVYRRKKKNRINKKRGTVAHNPEYFEGGHPDDPYAVINDTHVTTDNQMMDPAYNGSTLSSTITQSNGSCTNAGFDGMEDAVYDNSGERIVGSGYTSTIRRSVREYETPAGASSSRAELQTDETGSHVIANQSGGVVNSQRRGNLYVDVNGNKNKSNTANQSDMTESEASSVEPSSSGYTKGHTDEEAPNYFVLSKSD